MSQSHPLEADDSLTIDGADLLTEIRAFRDAQRINEQPQTAPTRQQWKPVAAPTEAIIDTSGTKRTLSRPQLVAVMLACLLGLGAAAATWRTSESPTPASSIQAGTP